MSLKAQFLDYYILFLIFINDLNYAIKNSIIFYFVHDTCFLNVEQSIKEINKSVNKGIKTLSHRLSASKIFLNNATKTDVVIFRAKTKVFDIDLMLKSSPKLFPSHHVKYLRVYTDKYLSWSTHVNQLCVKLIKANAMFPKIWDFINKTIPRSIYFEIFQSHLSYVCTDWGYTTVSFNIVCIIQTYDSHIIMQNSMTIQPNYSTKWKLWTCWFGIS